MHSDFRAQIEHRAADLAAEIRAAADVTGMLPNGKDVEKVIQDLYNDTHKALAMAECYHELYPLDPAEWEIVAIEQPVTTMIAGIKRPVTGTLDLVVREKTTGHLWLPDHKTSTDPPLVVAAALKFDLQLVLYRLLAMAAFPNDIIAGFIHQIIQKPTIKFCPGTKDADFDAYIRRVKLWYEKREAEAKIVGPKRAPFLRSKTEFFGFHLPPDFVILLKRADRAARRNLRPSGHPRCCNKYICTGLGGLPACPYLPLCSSRMSTWGLELMAPKPHYIQAHRDDLEKKENNDGN